MTDRVYVIRAVYRSKAVIYQWMAWSGIIKNDTANCFIDVHCKLTFIINFHHQLSLVYKCSLLSFLVQKILQHQLWLQFFPQTLQCCVIVLSLNFSSDANPNAHTYHFYLNGKSLGNSNFDAFNINVKKDR